MNRDIRDGETDEAKEVKLCKRAMRLACHIDWASGLASGRSLGSGPITGQASDTDLHRGI